MKIRLLSAALIFSLPVLAAFAADPLPRATPESVGMSSERLARIGTALRADIDKGRIPGAVVAIARKGKLVYFEAFGYLDKAAGTKMTTDAIFNIASMTKPMVTAGALMLYEEGRLPIDDPLSNYLPQFAKMRVAVMSPDNSAIIDTVPAARPDHDPGPDAPHLGHHLRRPRHDRRAQIVSSQFIVCRHGAELLAKLSAAPLMYQPGTVWDYGFSIDLVGLVVERISGQSLGQYLQQRLLKPLGMVDTGFMVPPEKIARYAKALPNDPDTGRRRRWPI